MARKLPAALKKKYEFSDELYEVTGKSSGTRQQAIKWIWEYIKGNDLQDPNDGRIILPDATLKGVLPKRKVKMTEIGKYLTDHLFE